MEGLTLPRERRKKLTASELKAAGVSREIVVRKIRPSKSAETSLSETAKRGAK